MSEDTTRLEWLGSNLGPIPIRCPSGIIYRVASHTNKYINAADADVDYLLGNHKFRKVRAPEDTKQLDESFADLQEPKIVKPVEVEQVYDTVDTSTIKALEESLKGRVSLVDLKSSLAEENEQDKPRAGIVSRLENAIADFDTSNL